MIVIGNAFSLNMLSGDANLAVEVISEKAAAGLINRHRFQGGAIKSVVGHADMAALYTKALGVEVPFNRETYTMQEGVPLLVGQYTGPRLPEGASALPEGARITWYYLWLSVD